MYTWWQLARPNPTLSQETQATCTVYSTPTILQAAGTHVTCGGCPKRTSWGVIPWVVVGVQLHCAWIALSTLDQLAAPSARAAATLSFTTRTRRSTCPYTSGEMQLKCNWVVWQVGQSLTNMSHTRLVIPS